MPRWYERANEASFKSRPEGHLFQAPSPWMLARPHYYVVNDAQKAELLARLGRWRLLLMIATVIELSFILSMILWLATFGRLFLPVHHLLGTGLFALFLVVLMTLLTVPFFAVPQIYLARALRPILTNARRSAERITLSEQLPRIAASVSGKVLVAGLIGGLAMISGSILMMFDAFLEGYLARSAPPNAVIFIIGGLLTAYFVYLLRLKAKLKRTKAA